VVFAQVLLYIVKNLSANKETFEYMTGFFMRNVVTWNIYCRLLQCIIPLELYLVN